VWGSRDGMNTYAGGLGALRKAIKMAARLTEINLRNHSCSGLGEGGLQPAAGPHAAGDDMRGNTR